MASGFRELDYQETPLGAISLRQRPEPRLGGQLLFEVQLGDEFLMSSLFTEAEIQLSKLALRALADRNADERDIVVGGLGLGYTALAALEDDSVKRLTVIEVMAPVIDCHRRGLVPIGDALATDSRCELVHADFFALATSQQGFDSSDPGRRYDAVLLDIDHSPSHWLNPGNAQFYTESSLAALSHQLVAGGIFGLWSNDPPEPAFTTLLESVFASVEEHVVTFPNPYTGGESANSVYLAYTRGS
jgi:spermidine synthase